MKYYVGQAVQAYYDDDWYDGAVKKANANGTYYVQFVDGDVLEDAIETEIRLPIGDIAIDDISKILTEIKRLEAEKAAAEPSTVGVDTILSRVEYFLLPLPRDRVHRRHSHTLLPTQRLEDMLHEVSIAEYIRLLQFLYRDHSDELQLGLELRSSKESVSMKQWVEAITEARARVVPLCRLCYKDESLESLRALVDLGSIYAVQGLWPQVSEHMTVASQKLVLLLNNENHEAKFALKRRRLLSAAYITTIFRVLQDHAMKNRGYITADCVKEMEATLVNTTTASQSSPEVTNKLEERIQAFCQELQAVIGTKPQPLEQSENFIYIDEPEAEHGAISWGRVVDYLRHESPVMQSWIADVEAAMLVQNKATLRAAFSMGDREFKGVCHPVELSRNLMKYPAATRICSGTQIIQDLSKLSLQVPIAIDKQHKTVVQFDVRNIPASSVQVVTYELPVSWEEFLAFAVLNTADQNQYDMIRLQILNLLGLCNVFSNKLSVAEEHMKHALGKLEELNWDMELVSIEVYNSISQLMVVKHRQWHAEKKDRCLIEAENWLQTTEGKAALKNEVRNIKKAITKKVSPSYAETKARAALVKSRMKEILANDADPTKPSLEAAYRYLVRSFEILESSHGANHATVASTALAIASVQNVMANYEESKEWLIRAVRIMEKLNPPPQRAIAFTQTQLSNILVKLRHPKSAIKVLIAAAEYYAQHASHGLLVRSQGESPMVSHYLVPGEQLSEDVVTSMELMARLMQLYHETGSKWQAAEQAENMAELAEAAYGWDSAEHADNRKLAGDRQCAVQDWARACANYKRSIDAYDILFGSTDSRRIAVFKLLQKAEKRRDVALRNILSSDGALDGNEGSLQDDAP